MTSLKATRTGAIRSRNTALDVADSSGESSGMPIRLPAFSLLVLAILAGSILQACGGGSSTTSTTIKSIAITPTAITVPLNTQTNFTAVVTLSDSTTSTTTTVTWEVNGIAGGNAATVGSIVASPNDQLIGVYTAPGQVPTMSSGSGEQLGQVNITAIAQQTNSTTSSSGTPNTGTVTSNTAIVTVGSGSGLVVTPASATVPAGGTRQFSALLNGLADASATWTVTTSGGASVVGSIDATGRYTAPLSPPTGASVTISATDPAAVAPATATVTIVYSDHSLTGPYAFSYSGNDDSGFLAVAGSFVADGNGHIVSGVEDLSSFLTGVSTQLQINGNSSTYAIGADGRGSASINTTLGRNTLDFVMTTASHAQLTRFDTNNTGSGSMDQQSVGALSNSPSVITGPYVFAVLGDDAAFNPLAMAGKFSADGSGGVPQTSTVLDVNDNGISGSGKITTGDTTLSGIYAFDPVFPGTGRGTLTLTSATTGVTGRVYAFYAVSSPQGSSDVVRLRLVEIDGTLDGKGGAFVAGDMLSASAAPGLANATFVFTGGGNSGAGAYAAGGVFAADGTGTVTSGVFDANSGGTYNTGPTISSGSYVVDPAEDRIDLKLVTSSTAEFAVYPSSVGPALMLEIDATAVLTGAAFQQCGPQSAGCSGANPTLGSGSLALGLGAEGVFHGSQNQASFQPDFDGQISFSGTSITSGNLDLNNFSGVFATDPVATTSSVQTPASDGRGTAVLSATNPAATFKLVYYLVDDKTALLFDQDATSIASGVLLRQF
ncbi:MAG TPA: hypothetical protein VJO53_07405 [Candidatus Acidoferrales bacterium]|nr:hypothetical protein [Candidatus Acidoferrales bacterium]